MRAAERQTERTSKPVISLSRKNWKIADEELLEPQLFADVFTPFRLRNVGNGTALEVHWRFKTEEDYEVIHGMIPHIQPNRILKTGLNANQIGLKVGTSRIFTCEYISISNDKYRSTVKLQGSKIVEFHVEKLSP